MAKERIEILIASLGMNKKLCVRAYGYTPVLGHSPALASYLPALKCHSFLRNSNLAKRYPFAHIQCLNKHRYLMISKSAY